jgi:hypothetical protein
VQFRPPPRPELHVNLQMRFAWLSAKLQKAGRRSCGHCFAWQRIAASLKNTS